MPSSRTDSSLQTSARNKNVSANQNDFNDKHNHWLMTYRSAFCAVCLHKKPAQTTYRSPCRVADANLRIKLRNSSFLSIAWLRLSSKTSIFTRTPHLQRKLIANWAVVNWFLNSNYRSASSDRLAVKMDHDHHAHHMHHHVENASAMPVMTTAAPEIHNHHDHSAHGTEASTGNVMNHAMHHMMEMAVSLKLSCKTHSNSPFFLF